jgi:hypothetical protein
VAGGAQGVGYLLKEKVGDLRMLPMPYAGSRPADPRFDPDVVAD